VVKKSPDVFADADDDYCGGGGGGDDDDDVYDCCHHPVAVEGGMVVENYACGERLEMGR